MITLTELKKYSSIGNYKGIMFLCKNVVTGTCVDIPQVLAKYWQEKDTDLKLMNGLVVLQYLGLVEVNGSVCKSTIVLSEDDAIKYQLCSIITEKLIKENLLNISSIKYLSVNNCYKIDVKDINNDVAVLRNILIVMECLELHETSYYITKYFEPILKKYISKVRTITPDELLKKLENEKVMGEEGELFVLQYEKQRCPFSEIQLQNITKISDIDVSAGYDIVSYEDEKSNTRRFIEVKTYSGIPHFYWSANEREVAKLRRSFYHLYLVDYNRIKEVGYQPLVIKNPYEILDREWLMTPNSWYVTHK